MDLTEGFGIFMNKNRLETFLSCFSIYDLQPGIGVVQDHAGISWKAVYEPESLDFSVNLLAQ